VWLRTNLSERLASWPAKSNEANVSESVAHKYSLQSGNRFDLATVIETLAPSQLDLKYEINVKILFQPIR